MTHTDAGPRASARAAELFARDPTCVALGLRLVEAGPGRASVALRVTAAMLNAHGITHGGYLFLLADAAFAVASNTHGPTALAQSAQISFLRPVEAGEDLLAEAVERTRHGRVGVYDVTVRRADGAVVAEFRGQSALLSAGRTPQPMEDR